MVAVKNIITCTQVIGSFSGGASPMNYPRNFTTLVRERAAGARFANGEGFAVRVRNRFGFGLGSGCFAVRIGNIDSGEAAGRLLRPSPGPESEGSGKAHVCPLLCSWVDNDGLWLVYNVISDSKPGEAFKPAKASDCAPRVQVRESDATLQTCQSMRIRHHDLDSSA